MEAFLLSRDHHKVRSLRGETLSDSQADANARAGDDSDFVFQSKIHKRSQLGFDATVTPPTARKPGATSWEECLINTVRR